MNNVITFLFSDMTRIILYFSVEVRFLELAARIGMKVGRTASFSVPIKNENMYLTFSCRGNIGTWD